MTHRRLAGRPQERRDHPLDRREAGRELGHLPRARAQPPEQRRHPRRLGGRLCELRGQPAQIGEERRGVRDGGRVALDRGAQRVELHAQRLIARRLVDAYGHGHCGRQRANRPPLIEPP